MSQPTPDLIMFSWTHFMLSSIQHGIQAGHDWMDMAVKYQNFDINNAGSYAKSCLFWQWARKEKTVNVRNGGDQTALIDIVKLFQRPDNPYPWSQFREDKSLNECLTSVSIVVPKHVFTWEAELDVEDHDPNGHLPLLVDVVKNPLDSFDQELYNLIKSTRHAT